METVKIVYDNKKDKELIELSKFSTPFFIELVNANKDKRKAFEIKNPYAARLNPFILLLDNEDKFLKCYYSETGNAIQQFINEYGSKN